jgi:hypothetical protein
MRIDCIEELCTADEIFKIIMSIAMRGSNREWGNIVKEHRSIMLYFQVCMWIREEFCVE